MLPSQPLNDKPTIKVEDKIEGYLITPSVTNSEVSSLNYYTEGKNRSKI